MNNKLYQNTEFAISIENLGDNIEILEKWNDFIIEERGIYTLEGENQSGKSLLIKMLMGALPPKVKEENSQFVLIENERIEISSVNKARENGLQAVFQDDTLIPTMTIKEQIELKHLKTRTLGNYSMFLWNFLIYYFEHFINIFSKNNNIESFIKKITFKKEKVYPEKILIDKASDYLLLFGLDNPILNKYPNQLSGGTIARIRIALSFLNENIKILFLDEAINAIDKESKLSIIDTIKELSVKKNISLVVVTHNEREIYRWQPKGRFFIKNKNIYFEGSKNFDGLDPSINLPKKFIVKFNSVEKAISYFKQEHPIKEPYIFLIDNNVKNNPVTRKLFNTLNIQQSNINCFFIQINENNKNIDAFKNIVKNILLQFPKANGTFFLIGGGVLINLGLMVCGTINRGLNDFIIIPTTIMAISDVATGSKASLNINGDLINSKHKIGLYSNPIATISDIGYVKTLTFEQIKIGLSESLKHAILQNIELFNDIIDLLKMGYDNTTVNQAYNIAITTRDLKSQCLAIDPFEKGYSNILLFGHLHAHSIESICNFSIPHGIAVYFGLLIDILLNNNEIFDKIKFILTDGNLSKWFKVIKDKINNNFDELEKIYNNDNKSQHFSSPSEFNIIKVDRLGQYKNIGTSLEIFVVDWNEIKKIIYELLNNIN